MVLYQRPIRDSRGFQAHCGKILGDTRFTNNTAPDEQAQRRLIESIDRKLCSEAKASLESDISTTEVSAAIRSMRSHSSPGPDGFTAAFYQIDPDLLVEIRQVVFQYQLERGELLPHQRHSSIVVLLNKGDKSNPGNFRPITLIPVEVKVLSRVLAYRLKPVMPTLVSPDQQGFIPGRSIHHPVMLVRVLQHLVTCRHGKVIAAFLDFAKAYDRLRLVECHCKGSGAKLNHDKSVVMSLNNHRAAPAIDPLRSLHQGETVKYLEIPSGNLDMSTQIANQLDKRVMSRLRLWKGRARTLTGRRRIVQVMLLSVLWYFTFMVIIPNRFIKRWQAIVTRYILYNHINVGIGGTHIVKRNLAILPREMDGIGVPVFADSIRGQHLNLLQQTILALK
ncbi:hypothetical protein ON010_g8821 [Phytophthora cinnamomi]|nr:hypothetical protein ON010_g8821 [Phytophthora cinnamomi]